MRRQRPDRLHRGRRQLQVELAAAPGSTVLPGEDLAPTLLALSSTLFEADIAALATEETSRTCSL